MSLIVEMEDGNDATSRALRKPIPITTASNTITSTFSGQHVSRAVLKSLGEPPSRRPESSQSSRVRGSIFREVNAQSSSDDRIRGKAERRRDARSTSLDAAENDQSFYGLQGPVECFCEGTKSTSTTRTDSETSISRNDEAVSTMADTSHSSDDRKKAERKGYDSLRSGKDSTTRENEESDDITEAWKAFEELWAAQVVLTEEEKQNGYRFSKEIDPLYLGFYPRKRDKREYLNAYPIVGPLPDGELYCNCALPLTLGQWGIIAGSIVFFAAIGAGVYCYLSSQTLEL